MLNLKYPLFALLALCTSALAEPIAESAPVTNAAPSVSYCSWLGETTPTSGILRVSLYCSHCLHTLNEGYANPPANGIPPRIIINYYGEKDTLTPTFLSAIRYSEGATEQERFLVPFSILMQSFQNKQTIDVAKQRLRHLHPQISETDPLALSRLQQHSATLKTMQDRGTPAYYPTTTAIPHQADIQAIFQLQAGTILPASPAPANPAP